MNIAIILIILLVGAILTYFSGNRFASKVAILFSVAAAIFSVALCLKFGAAGTNYSAEWISNPNISFSLKADGLAIESLNRFVRFVIIQHFDKSKALRAA